MKSLNDNYTTTGGSSHETFSDLMFCALIVLVLFIMALAIEVSTRVKAELGKPVKPIPEVKAVELSTMTKEEVAELSKKLQVQQKQVSQLREKLKNSTAKIDVQKAKVNNQLAAMSGDQRFTGAREQAALNMAYDYSEHVFHFISARESAHSEKQSSGETSAEFSLRQTEELVAIALKARKQRGYSMQEAMAIYQAFSTYKEVEPSLNSYRVIDSVVGIHYISTLSGYIAGDKDLTNGARELIVSKLLAVYAVKGHKSDEMYPKVTLKVDLSKRKISINGVVLSAQDAKEILLSLDGRGAMIDLEGLTGKPPKWLTEGVLIPAGYISKTPKLPGQ